MNYKFSVLGTVKIGVLFAFFLFYSLNTQGQIITTIAGTGSAGFSGDGGAATAATISNPEQIFLDGGGNLFIADYGNNRVRKITPAGIISTIASGLSNPRGVVVDTGGNVYIADNHSQRVLKVTSGGSLSTFAGNGSGGYAGDGGAATAARLLYPGAVALDGSGNLYITDVGNHRIRKVTPAGIISTIAGNGTAGYSGDGGAATAAKINAPFGLAFDGSGNLYISDDGNSRVRKVTPAGIISTFAGNGTAGYSGDGGQATAAQVNPTSLTFDGSGNLYIAERANNRIRKLTPAGIITTIAGNGTAGYSGDGGAATAAEVGQPYGIAVDGGGNVYIADFDNNRIRKITLSASTSTSTTSLPSYLPTSGLVAWYPFTGNANDSSGNGNNGTNYGASLTADRFGSGNRAYSFDGTNDYVQVPNTSSINLTHQYSYSVWVKINNYRLNADGTHRTMISKQRVSGGTGFSLRSVEESSFFPRFTCGRNNSSTNVVLDGNDSLDVGRWDHIVYTYDGSVEKFYKNGSLTISNTISMILLGSSEPLFLGREFDDSAHAAWFEGALDDIAIYNRALSASEVAQLYNGTGTSNHPPAFVSTTSPSNTVSMCQDYGAYPLTEALAARDIDSGQTLTWSLATSPRHGTASVSYSTTSTGVVVRPVGVTYTPTAGYSGADSMRVTISDGVASSTSTFRIVVNPKPSAPVISGPSSVCSGNTITLTGTPSGGFFGSMDGNTSTNATSGVVTTRGTGSSTIYYNSPYNSYGCRTQTRVTISVLGRPAAATLSGSSSVCPGSAVAWTPSVAGGTWSSASPSIVTVSGTGSVIGVSPGGTSVTYRVSNGCFSTYTSKAITVSGATSVPAIDGGSYLYLHSTLTVSNTLAGGVWTSSDTSVAVISSTGVIMGIRPGTDTIIYTYTNSCGISSRYVKIVRVLSRGDGKPEHEEEGNSSLESERLNIFPNPTTASVTIELSGVTGTLDVVLLDNAGRTVLVLNGIGTRSVLDLSQLPRGEYLVNVKNSRALYSGKIVVE